MEPQSEIDSFVLITSINYLKLGAYSAISRYSVISGNYDLQLGCRSLIGSRCILQVGAGNIRLGEYSVLAPSTTIHTHGVFLPTVWGFTAKSGDVTIGDMVWVMQNCNISPKVEIESNVTVLPGSTVLKNILSDRMIKDDGITRKEFPLNSFKRKITKEWLINHIFEITEKFISTNLHAVQLIEKGETFCSFYFKGKRIIIRIEEPRDYPEDNDVVLYFFWFSLSKMLISYNHLNYFDFYELIYNDAFGNKEFENYFNGWIFHENGLKFVAQRFKNFAKILPPDFSNS